MACAARSVPCAAEVAPDDVAVRKHTQSEFCSPEAAALHWHAAKIELRDTAAAKIATVELAAADIGA